MADIGLTEIQRQLNSLFNKTTDNQRKLVFWYDEKNQFTDQIESLELVNAEVFQLKENHSLLDKLTLESKVHSEQNYLVYAPFKEPVKELNHFYAMSFYSEKFYADKSTMLGMQLGLIAGAKNVLKNHAKFFDNQERVRKFEHLLVNKSDEQSAIIAMIGVITGMKNEPMTLDYVIWSVIVLKDKNILVELDKFGLSEDFWKLTRLLTGYISAEPTLNNFIQDMFSASIQVMTSTTIGPAFSSDRLKDPKLKNAQVFLSTMKHDIRTRQDYKFIANEGISLLGGKQALSDNIPLEKMLDIALFKEIDDIYVEWITQKILDHNFDAKIDGIGILGIINKRLEINNDSEYSDQYRLLKHTVRLLTLDIELGDATTQTLFTLYQESLSDMDASYRKFYVYRNKIEISEHIDELTKEVNARYNYYLETLSTVWNNSFNIEDYHLLAKQEDFFQSELRYSDRTVVIISDAFRYEIGKDLAKVLNRNFKMTAKISARITGLPSITKLGMAALLPHNKINFDEQFNINVDGTTTDSTKNRKIILQAESANNNAISAKDIINQRRDELRQTFKGSEITYVYHNSIDAEGDKSVSEDGTLIKANNAISELESLINKIAVATGISRFVVTADHGFMYRQNVLTGIDKLDNPSTRDDEAGHRYILSRDNYSADGIVNYEVRDLVRTDSNLNVAVPLGAKIFNRAGGGQKYVHGGSTLQEMTIPVVHVSVSREADATENATLDVLSNVSKITTQVTNLEFVQTKPISDKVKPQDIRLYFIDQYGEHVSGETMFTLKNKDNNIANRRFILPFTFKNRNYDNQIYTLVVVDSRGEDLLRRDFYIDIPF